MTRWTHDVRHPRPVNRGRAGAAAMSRGGSGTPRPPDRPREHDERPRGPVVARRPEHPQVLPLRDLEIVTRGTAPRVLAIDGRAYQLTPGQTRALATIGAFRVIATDDLVDRGLLTHGDLARLGSVGLLKTSTIGSRRGTRHMTTLTHAARRLLDAHRDLATTRPQRYYAGLVKPAELAHDVELYPLYEIAAQEIRAAGGEVTRVVLDAELKAEYQTFLHRPEKPAEATLEDDRAAWAAAHDLLLVDDALQLPDLRVEYENAAGEPCLQDIEFISRYPSSVVKAKARAGFVLYRRPGISYRQGRGGRPPDPHLFERLV